MARRYTYQATELAVAANLEIFSLLMGGTSVNAVLKRLVISMTQTTLPTAQGLEFRLARMHTPTQNTSGSIEVPWQDDTGDRGSFATLYVGNSALSTGTVDWEWSDGCYLYTGRDIVFDFDDELVIVSGSLLSVSCPNAPSGSPTINAVLQWSEAGK